MITLTVNGTISECCTGIRDQLRVSDLPQRLLSQVDVVVERLLGTLIGDIAQLSVTLLLDSSDGLDFHIKVTEQ